MMPPPQPPPGLPQYWFFGPGGDRPFELDAQGIAGYILHDTLKGKPKPRYLVWDGTSWIPAEGHPAVAPWLEKWGWTA